MPEEKRKKTEFSLGKGRNRRRQQLREARAALRKQTSDSSAASVSDPVCPIHPDQLSLSLAQATPNDSQL